MKIFWSASVDVGSDSSGPENSSTQQNIWINILDLKGIIYISLQVILRK